MEKLRNIIIVGAHIDDTIIGCFSLINSIDGKLHLVSTTNNLPDQQRYPDVYKDYSSVAVYEKNLQEEIKLILEALKIRSYHEFSAEDGKSYGHIQDINLSLKRVVDDINPDLIVFPHYEGGHIDHDVASYLSSKLAIEKNIPAIEYALYNYDGGSIKHHQFIRGEDIKNKLDESMVREKNNVLSLLKTKQRDIVHFLDESFEVYRPFYRTDYLQRPHEGMLMYERSGKVSFRDFLNCINKIK